MCKGSDVLKVAAVAAAVYTGGTSLGLFGAEAAGAAAAGGAAAGGASGAIAGSEAFAAGVGAAGGDAIGSLIASNAANWGMSVAPEIAALGMGAGAAGGAAAAGAFGTGGEAATGAAVGSGAAAPAAAGGTGAATGASTWLQTAKTVAPFVSAAGSALTGIAALSGAARGVPDVQAAVMPAAPGQQGVSPDLYAALKKKNALLFAGAGPESTDLTKGSAGTGNLGKNALLGA